MERTLKINCPACKRRLGSPVEGMQTATQVFRRKCRGCGERWSLIVTPAAITVQGQAAMMDLLEFTKIEEAQ